MLYPAYLELAEGGQCMAHVLELPGCAVRAPGREAALRRLPDAIRSYHGWLRRHGEPAPSPDEQPQVHVAGESVGFGPFDPGDAAALFDPDREPLTPGDLERHLQLMGYSRADLLALVRGLADEVLDWQADAHSFSIRRLLRHIGNAEQWYVSRLAPRESLPPEWEHDEHLPILEFLEMERRTAAGRLRGLTLQERTAVHYPSAWTRHPHEPWTARKALRRFLEHEREHTAQTQEILAQWQTRSQ
ncbi:MAG TPA: type II toxin-antitoxin system HicB family antitoxin [Anaerolineae bacterium]|nr:type II toxin-antitoxin system HicB family antitoxin [Anaerolineae bacterium]HOQ99476.1 type II toxin-antitoxin system HicB family antitoxin [Anaerolineae bacterium]HPL28239.1 type II toxin-antitoxin system HicB family antitoxin [Anaerolineae bacterium]